MSDPTEVPATLELDGVTVRHGDAVADALCDVSMSVAGGQVLAVLGSSGSGKSTMLRAVAGLEPLVAGRVVLDGIDLADVPTHRRGVGLMFQEHVLFPHLDVGANVAFGLRMQGRSRRESAARVAELLGLVGLDGFEGRAIASLSGGERQRVALARALAPAPRVLLLDEPMGSLDRALRDRLVVELGEVLRSLSMTAVYVTHDHVEARRIADDLVVLDHGRILQRGRPAEVAAGPVDGHVARLMGVEPTDGPDR